MFKKIIVVSSIAAIGLPSLAFGRSHVRVKNPNDPEIIQIQRKLRKLEDYRHQVSLPNKKKWDLADDRAEEAIEDLKKRLAKADHSITESKRAMFASEQAMGLERRVYNRNSETSRTGYRIKSYGSQSNKYIGGGY